MSDPDRLRELDRRVHEALWLPGLSLSDFQRAALVRQVVATLAAPDPAPDRDGLQGADLIAAERQRQVEQEGWTPEHDAEHRSSALALAAVSYALPGHLRGSKSVNGEARASGRWQAINQRVVPDHWPWAGDFWKPTPDNRVRELVKAGALIAAEIDRLAAPAQAPDGSAP